MGHRYYNEMFTYLTKLLWRSNDTIKIFEKYIYSTSDKPYKGVKSISEDFRERF